MLSDFMLLREKIRENFEATNGRNHAYSAHTFDYSNCHWYDKTTKSKGGIAMSEKLTYHREGDYLIPELVAPEAPTSGLGARGEEPI